MISDDIEAPIFIGLEYIDERLIKEKFQCSDLDWKWGGIS